MSHGIHWSYFSRELVSLCEDLKTKPEFSALTFTPIGNDKLTNGLVVSVPVASPTHSQITTRQVKASLLFKTPLVESKAHPLVLSRVNLVGLDEPTSLWNPSQYQAFRRTSNNFAAQLAEIQIKYPDRQLTEFVVSFSNHPFFLLPFCFLNIQHELVRLNLASALDSV